LKDVAAMLLSLFAMWLSGRAANTKMTFGYHRAEILGISNKSKKKKHE